MTKEKSAGEEQTSVTIKLGRPITDGQTTWTELTITPPTLGHHMASEQNGVGMSQVVSLYASLAAVPVEAMKGLKTVDARKLEKAIEKLNSGKDAPAPVPHDVDGATFKLLTPIDAGGGRMLGSITLREPDLAAGIAIEKFQRDHEQTAASIAVLSGLTMPVVAALAMRDVRRIEAWLLPFVNDSNSSISDGEI